MSLKVVKGSENLKDSSGEAQEEIVGGSDSEKMFVVQITNYKKDVGYLGKREGRDVMLDKLTPMVTRFDTYKAAKDAGNKFHGCQIDILGSHRIEKILEKQGGVEVTVPLSEVETDLYHVLVKEKSSGELVGWMSYKRETDEYAVIGKEEGAAFWDNEVTLDNFIKAATGTFLAGNPDLMLEKKQYK